MNEKIIEILCRACESNKIKENPEIDLIESGLLDSLAFIELIDAVEEEFGIEIIPTNVPSTVWHEVKTIAEYISCQLDDLKKV